MNFDLDESTMRIIRNIFEWSDNDGDGKVSRDDLKKASGLKTEDDVEAIFRALKEASGGSSEDLYISYEEFCKGIMDFPFLIDQYKLEFQSRDVPEEVLEIDYSDSNDVQRDNDMEFLSSKLKEAIFSYNKALKVEPTEITTSNSEDLLEILRLLLERLWNKCKQDTFYSPDIIHGSIELYLLVRDLSRFHEEVASDLKGDLYELQSSHEALNKKCEKLMESNEKLLSQIYSLEKHEKVSSKENFNVLEEKRVLEMKLEKAEMNEVNYQSYIEQVEQTIMNKEKEIAQMEKQLRQLNSLKTLQEMRGTSGRTTEDMKLHRIGQKSSRQSVPVKNLSVTRSIKPVSGQSDIKIQIISTQLKRKNEEILTKATELDEMELAIKKYYDEIIKLRHENDELREKNRALQFSNAAKTLEDRESLMLPTLHEELKLLKGGSVMELTPEPAGVFSVWEARMSGKNTVELETKAVQTEELVIMSKIPPPKNREGCFSCIN